MEILVIIAVIALAQWIANRAPTPSEERLDNVEERVNEVGEQVADFLLKDE